MTDEDFRQALLRLKTLYAKTKGYIIRAEEIDRSLRSNIAVFKEQRDGLDHIMRAVNEYLEKGNAADTAYIRKQFDDAEGHLYRAAYDALDGMGISYKIRIDRVMENFSIRTIQTIYPKYFDAVEAINAVEDRIVEHRNNKDQRRTTLAELDEYFDSIQRIDAHSKSIFKKIPFFQKAQNEERRNTRLYFVLVPVGIALLVILGTFANDWYWRKRDAKMQQPSPALSSPSPVASSPPASKP